MSESFDCPHCGQDLRLPPDALAKLEAMELIRNHAQQVMNYGPHHGLGETTQWRLLRKALAAGQEEEE